MAPFAVTLFLTFIFSLGCAEDAPRDPMDPTGTEGSSDGDTDADADGDSDSALDTGQASGRWAEGIHISRVEANQGAAVAISENGQLVEPGRRAVGLIRGRAMLVRAYWSLDDGWQTRDIIATLSLQRSDGSVETVQDSVVVSHSADPDTLAGAFSWRLEADQVTPSSRYRIELRETASSDFGTAEPGLGAKLPLDGFADLGIIDADMTLKIVIVPFAPPGGSAVPVSDSDRQTVEDAFMELSPVQSIDVTWGNPYSQSTVYTSVTAAWDDIQGLRDRLGLAPDQYLQALLNPEGCCDMGVFNFKGRGFTPGESAGDFDAEDRCAMVMIETDVGLTAPIMVHELGHNQGLSHAPCGDIDNTDPAFPYAGGKTGTQGYGILSGELHSGNPDIDHPFFDIMTYCWPVWYSDYHFERIRQRIQAVTAWGG